VAEIAALDLWAFHVDKFISWTVRAQDLDWSVVLEYGIGMIQPARRLFFGFDGFPNLLGDRLAINEGRYLSERESSDMKHSLSSHLLTRPVKVAVIGTGGNGSIVAMGLPYIHQAMLLAGHPGGLDVTLIDGDVVSASNCIRQPFGYSEVGLPKATVLVSRINLFWDLRWKSIPERLSDDHRLWEFDLVIGCVDTRSARAEIAKGITGLRSQVSYYLDMGNGVDGGQFVLGQPLNSRNPRKTERLRTVAELFPEIVDSSLDDDALPSCSALESLERQLY
jgi:PRTRC genetic system ThiF family protein